MVLVFIDSGGVDPEHTRKGTVSISRHLNRLLSGISIRYVVEDHSLEGWLACDEEALRATLGPRAQICITGNPENHPRPAELMREMFRRNRKKSFGKTIDNLRIAENVDPQNILTKSPTFRRLRDVLRSA